MKQFDFIVLGSGIAGLSFALKNRHPDPALLLRIKKVIEQVEAARTFQQISNLKL